MDQLKIGKFIAGCRKECGLTQAQLAEQLGITNRAVSKWETGKSMPDVTAMMPLCEILHISVNELLSGEKLSMENYKEKAEQNLVDLQEKQQRADKAMTRAGWLWILVGVLLLPVHFAINYYFPENAGTGAGLLFILVGAILYLATFTKHYEVRVK